MIVPIHASVGHAALHETAKSSHGPKLPATGFMDLLLAHMDVMHQQIAADGESSEALSSAAIDRLLVHLGEWLSQQRQEPLFDGKGGLPKHVLYEAASLLDGELDESDAMALAAHLWGELTALVQESLDQALAVVPDEGAVLVRVPRTKGEPASDQPVESALRPVRDNASGSSSSRWRISGSLEQALLSKSAFAENSKGPSGVLSGTASHDAPEVMAGISVREAVALLQDAYGERSVPARFEPSVQQSGPQNGSAPALLVVGAAQGGPDPPGNGLSSVSAVAALPRAWATLETVGEVAVQNVRYMVIRGEETITVRLVPPSLGEVRIEVIRVEDSLSLRLASASPTVRTLIEGQLPELRQALAQDGIELARATVSADLTGGHPENGTSERPGASFDQAFRDNAWRTRRESGDASTSPSRASRQERLHDGTLSIYA